MADKNYGITTVVADDNSGDGYQNHRRQREGDTDMDKPVFERYISLIGILNFGFCLQGAWEAMGLMLSIAMLNGGPVAVVWGCVISGVGHVATAASLGEMASMDPTVGAQYRWSARFARSHNEFWGLVQGWLTTFAWVVGCITNLQMIATAITALISFYDPSYVAKNWHTMLLIWSMLLITLLFNLVLRRLLNTLETLGGIFHILFFVAIVVVLVVMGERSSTSYVFTTLTNDVSGWTNKGIAFHLGMSAAFLPLSGYDSVLHMIDETKEPRKRVPYSMVFSTALNFAFAFAYLLVVMYYIGDPFKASQSTMPIIEIYYAATKSKTATTIMVLMHCFTMLVSGMNIIASASRLTWAFARDKGLPFHEYFSQVNTTLQIPLQALGLAIVSVIILSLINLGSTVALSAFSSLNAMAILFSYIPPISLLLIRKLSGEHPRYGPFQLGRWGVPINLLAIAFLIWGTFWMTFPIMKPITAETMNYAGPIFVALVAIILVDWFTTGKKRFRVPTGEYNIEMQDMQERKRSGDASCSD